MNNLQNNLNVLQNTIDELANIINNSSVSSGGPELITKCTSFADYPELLRSVMNSSSSGLATVFAYKISDVNPGIPDDTGDFDFDTNTYTPPKNWSSANDLNASDTDTVWMTQAMFAKNNKISETNNPLVTSWSNPVKISSFSVPEPSEKIQTVYLSTSGSTIPSKPIGTNDSILNADSLIIGWTENYLGLIKDKPYTWVSTRKKEYKAWSDYSTPVLYSYYAKDGEDGKSIVSNRTIFAFIATPSREEKPSKPRGGQWDINSNNIILPDGWSESPNTDLENPYTWMSTAIFSAANPINPDWTDPVCITGEDGVDGTDGVNSEFIYAILRDQEDFISFKNYFNSQGLSLEVSQTDTIPNFIYNGKLIGTAISINRPDGSNFKVQLTDSPIGINNENKIEIYWTRSKSGDKWNGWTGPMYWSVWGENGMDGDGIEYIFTASNDATCDTPLPVYEILLKENPEEAKKFQEREYIPEGWFDNDDDWGGVGPDVPYLFCSSRQQYTDETTGEKLWSNFTTPKIWGHWGKDGTGSYTSFAFCVTKNDISNYSVIGGYYGNPLQGLITRDENGKVVEWEWSDTVPYTPAFDETIWMINKLFNNTPDEEFDEWFGPTKMADSEHFQVEFNCPVAGDSKSFYDPNKTLISLQTFKELKEKENITYATQGELESAWRKYVYDNGFGSWNDGGSGAIYMATARFINNKWEEWSVNKVQGEAGDSNQFIFKLTDGSNPDDPNPINLNGDYQDDGYFPSGWNKHPLSVSEDLPICWVSERSRKNGIWEEYSTPSKWAIYAKGNVHLELTEDEVNIPCEPDGSVDNDYANLIKIGLLLYDNGELVSGEYEAIINGDSDFKITTIFNSEPTDTTSAGFYGNNLYIGRDVLDRYVSDEKLRVECKAIYKGAPYTKAFIINKSTNTYELVLSHNILHLDSDGEFKDAAMTVQAVKWVEDRFIAQSTGYVEYIITKQDGSTLTGGDAMDADTVETIYLSSYKDVKSIKINYRLTKTSDILTSEVVGTVLDGKNGEDGKDGKDAISKFSANLFCRTNADIGYDTYSPKGGSFEFPDNITSVPIPDKSTRDEVTTKTTQWTDGIPKYDFDNPKQLWMTKKVFYSDNSQGELWDIPVLWQETNNFDIWWCDEEVSNPGTPSNPLAKWYDGDSDDGNEATKSPVWMATQRTHNGVKENWVVTRVKGEKGDKGDKGEDGADGTDGINGGFGPMARYSIWNVNPPARYYSRSGAEKANYDWYDIVEHNDCYYLCEIPHDPSTAHEPGVDNAHWTLSSHFDFITAKSAAIQDLVADRIQTHKLTTVGNGARIYIHDGLMEVFGSNSDDKPNIRFGVDEVGRAILEFLDEEGNVLYDLGPTYGYRVRTTTTEIERYNAKEGFYKVGVISDWNLSDRQQTETAINDVIKDRDIWTSSTLHVYEHTINGEAQADNGKYYAAQNKTNPINGVYFYKIINLGNWNSINSGEGRYSISDIQMFNEKYPGCEVQIDLNTIGTYYASTIYYIENGVLDLDNLITVFWLEEK